MSCQSCCVFDVAKLNDFAAGGYYIYPTQDYSFVITTCPIGFLCAPGVLPQTVVVKKGGVPPVTIPPNPRLLTLQGCQSLITALVPPGSSASVIAGIAAGMQQQFAAQQANCNLAKMFNFPVINSTTDIFNTAQTASCTSPQFGTPVTIAAGTVGVTIFNATTADVMAAQAAMNNLALQMAKAQLFCFNPGPDWRQLVWDTYTFHTNATNTITGGASGNTASGVLVKDNGNFFPEITPVHAGGLFYTGPQVVCTLKLVISASSGGVNIETMTSRVKVNGVPLAFTPNGGNPVFPAVGTYLFTFTVPLSNNALIEIDDASPGNVFAGVDGNGMTGNVSFVKTFFQ
jgi:hypothetical protein